MTATLPARIETERLVLRPLARADLPFLVELHADREVTRFLGGNGDPRTPEEVEAWFELVTGWYGRDQLGPYAIARASDGGLVGRAGLSVFELDAQQVAGEPPVATWGIGSAPPGREVTRVLEIGYVVHPSAQGNGYAPEAARAWMRFAFEAREVPFVTSYIHGDNAASIRVAEKNGLRHEGESVRMEGREYLWYRCPRERWDAL